MRLFLAIPLPQDIVAYVRTLQSRLPRDSLRLPESLHITIQFLGDVDEGRLDELKTRLAKVAHVPFKLALDVVQAFPDWHKPRVLWVGVTPQEQVLSLHNVVARALQGMFPPEERFKAHITLARVRDTLDPPTIETMKALSVEKRTFSVDKLILFRSVLQRGGPIYTELMTIPLKA